MKAGTQNHVKTKRLKRVLGIPLYRAVGILESIWLLCCDCCDEGNIGKFTDDEIADYLEWDGKPSELVCGLAESGWTDTDDTGRPVVHDWLEHCPEYIKERVRKRQVRAAKSNKQTTYVLPKPDNSGQVRDQPPLVPSIPNPTQPNQFQPNPTKIPPGGGGASPSNGPPKDSSNGSKPKPSKPAYTASFERWYAAYPRKVAKEEAAAAFGRTLPKIVVLRTCPTEEALEWLISVTQRFARSGTGRDGKFCPYPATWLNKGRYDDDPAEWDKTSGGSNGKHAIGPGQTYDPSAAGRDPDHGRM
jgi:hypothetical protein